MKPAKRASSPSKKYPPGSFMYKVRKRRIIETLAAFIGGGWLTWEAVHWILVEHYHFPEKLLDITLVTLIGAMLCTLTWRWLGGREKKIRGIKPELILIPLFILITAFFDVRFIQQLKEPEAETISETRWKNSIAVLPFDNISPEEGQEYFCDGMTDEIIAKLSTLKELKVISRTSVMRYKNKDKSIKEIGQELDVASVLEGSVRKERDDIRITVQLINVKHGFHLWSDIYDRKLERIFDVQSDVAENIVNALQMRLTLEENKQLSRNPTENLEAYNLYLQGRFFWNKRTEDGLKKSIEFFEKAVEIDQMFALAYAGIADSYVLLGVYQLISNKVAYPKAIESASKALEIDDSLAEAHTSLAHATLFYDWDWKKAEMEYKRAIELNPRYPTGHHWYAFYLASLTFYDEAIEEMKKALELDPLSLILSVDLALIYLYIGQYDRAIEQCKKTLELDQNFWKPHSILGWVYLKKGNYEKAIESSQKALQLFNTDTALAYLGNAYGVSNKKDESKKILEQLLDDSKRRYVSPYLIAIIYAALDDKDQAFRWLEKAYDERLHTLIYLKPDPLLDGLKTDPRFKELLKRMNLE